MTTADRRPPREQRGAAQRGAAHREACSTLAIGLMSGTSIDGIDGVLLSLNAPQKLPHQIAIEATVHTAFPAVVQKQISAVITEPSVAVDELGRLDSRLGDLYAQTANRLKPKSGEAVAVIGCHGQTIRHQPDGKFPFTFQLGNGAIIAQRTGIPVVTDFRSADMAAGGQGAPLAPAFHQAVFASRNETRAVLNLGGIANITHLPAAEDDGDGDDDGDDDNDSAVVGFDTGPANTLLDHWCRRHFNAPFDRHGTTAAAGAVQQKLLDNLLSDPYFHRPPPKSTGREYFNEEWLGAMLADAAFAALPPTDIQATLTALTAETVAHQLNQLTPSVATVYVCGGGVHNQTLMAMLGARCRAEIKTTAELGIDPQWVEACAFAWMADKTIRRIPATLPSVTGALKPTIAGGIYFPD